MARVLSKNILGTQRCISTRIFARFASTNHRLEPCQSDKLTDIGTRRIFQTEHDIFRGTVRKFFREHIIPYHEKWEEDGEVDRECCIKAGEAGILNVNIPAEKGGIGGDWLSACNCTRRTILCKLLRPRIHVAFRYRRAILLESWHIGTN